MKLFIGICLTALIGLSFAGEIEPLDEIICPGGHTGLVPHPIYCAFFYICDNGKPELLECPSQLYFNPIRFSCDLPESVPNCEGGTRPPTGSTTIQTTTRPTSVPTQTTTREPVTPETEATMTTRTPIETEPTILPSTSTSQTTTTTQKTTTTPRSGDLTCPNNTERIYMPYPNDCTRFYFCEFGIVTRTLSCNTNLWFKFTLQACMTPWGTNCDQ